MLFLPVFHITMSGLPALPSLGTQTIHAIASEQKSEHGILSNKYPTDAGTHAYGCGNRKYSITDPLSPFPSPFPTEVELKYKTPLHSVTELKNKKRSLPFHPNFLSFEESCNRTANPKRTLRRKAKSEQRDNFSNTIPNEGRHAFDSISHNIDHSGGNLDLLSLTELYLDNRQKLFGDEWIQKRKKAFDNRKTSEVGPIGISKPRRLSPLRSKSVNTKLSQDELNYFRSIQGRKERDTMSPNQMPAPRGLHLSANYSAARFGLESFSLMNSRLRIGNSLENIRPHSVLEDIKMLEAKATTHRPNSAPGGDNNTKINKLINNSDLSARQPHITPARANTPTEGLVPTQQRSHLIGESLVDVQSSPTESLNVSRVGKDRSKVPIIDKPTERITVLGKGVGRPLKKGFLYSSPSSSCATPSHRDNTPLSFGSLPATSHGRKKSSKVHLSPLDLSIPTRKS